MKRILLLSALFILACSSDDSSDTNDNNDNNNNNLVDCETPVIVCSNSMTETLVFGSQEWTSKNYCNTTYRDGTPIPQVTNADEWANLTTGAWCFYENDPTKGVLYNWYAVMGIHDTDPNTPNKEFAPEGWHVPSRYEWEALGNTLVNEGYNFFPSSTSNSIGKAMASKNGWKSSSSEGSIGKDQCSNNNSGFEVYPVGGRNLDGIYNDEGYSTGFWSTTETSNNILSFSTCFFNQWSYVRFNCNVHKSFGNSVRLVKD